MRKYSMLESFFPGIRGRILSAALLQPEHWWFMSELARYLDVTPSSLQRQLDFFTDLGVLLKRKDGRRIYFKANVESPLYAELKGLVEKTAGIIPTLSAELDKFAGRIDTAFLYGSIAQGKEHSGSDVDLMIIGRVKQIELLPVLRKMESRFLREVNVTLYSPEEFSRKLEDEDHFLTSVLKHKTILLKGALHELEETATRKQGSQAFNQPTGT